MLASTQTISVVADALKRLHVGNIVVDPVSHCHPLPIRPVLNILEVMVATTGAQLLPEDAIQTLLKELLPVTTILTPNVPEAELLVEKATSTKRPIARNLDDLLRLAKELVKLGPNFVLLKGGHLLLPKDGKQLEGNVQEGKYIHNILAKKDGEPVVLRSRFQDSNNTHGTGCSLASKIESGASVFREQLL